MFLVSSTKPMERPTKKKKRISISKTWKKMKSFGRSSKKDKSSDTIVTKYEKSKNPVFQKTDALSIQEERTTSPVPPSPPPYSAALLTESLSCPCSPQRSPTKQKNKKTALAPQGCFTVYVGPEKQRFVVRAKMVNHPLFQALLEDAEEEYGYQREGPIVLPCQISFFFRILAEIESLDDDDSPTSPVCGLFSPRSSSSYHLLSAPSSFRLNDF